MMAAVLVAACQACDAPGAARKDIMPPNRPTLTEDTGPHASITVRRLGNGPIIRPDMLPGTDGRNINGPSLIRVPEWVPDPLGRYYLYFANHSGTYIRLAYADRLQGPWKVYDPGTLRLEDVPAAKGHIASPDVHIDEAHRRIRMYFHGTATDRKGQVSFVATSSDGLHFTPSDEVLGLFYFRVFKYGGYWYALAKGGELYRSRNGLTDFECCGNPFPPIPNQDRHYNRPGSVRHTALYLRGDVLDVYYSRIGDAPESILLSTIDLRPDCHDWKASEPQLVLRPERDYEGVAVAANSSRAGSAKGPENALRDPGVFVEDGRLYLLYSVAGESGIAMAEILDRQ